VSCIVIPSTGPDSWKQFLAQPDLHWATGYSARTLAHSWEANEGLPPEVGSILTSAVGQVTPLLVIPERKTPLPGGRRESQSDAFLIGRSSEGLVACTVEGKVDEAFGPTVADQMRSASAGKRERLNYLCSRLGLSDCPGSIHYQLLHRTVSALIGADNFAATHAAMIVHSFSPERRWFDAFANFANLLGAAEVATGEPIIVEVPDRRLILGWACGDQRFRGL
jgi:hypothetical protein